MSVWIVIPTYNERSTIAALIQRIRRQQTGDILVVDDSSPDGTSQAVEGLRQSDPHLHLLTRPLKTGLAAAYRDGLRLALDRGADPIIHLDADGSHDPSLMAGMIDRLADADLVIASRYVPGGSLDIPWYRRWISQIGNLYIRILLGGSVHDWSTGYKAWRAETLRPTLAAAQRAVGYAWLIETTWQAVRLGARVVEVPLRFADRRQGQSKFSWAIMREDIRLAWRLHRTSGLVKGKKT